MSTSISAETRRIDLHTHVFNLRSIPVRGILERWHVPSKLALALAKLLLAMVKEDSPSMKGQAMEVPGVPGLDAVIDAIAEEAPAEIFADDEFLAGFAYLDPAELSVVLSSRHGGVAAAVGAAGADIATTVAAMRGVSVAVVADSALRKGLVKKLLEKIAKIIDGGLGALRFLHLLTRPERAIYALFRRTYGEVTHSVHHMMDLALHYGGDEPTYSYPSQQVRRMLALAKESEGRLLIFVAFDPYRAAPMTVIQQAIAAGCTGVKFYPPSGYRPTGNQDGMYKDAPPAHMLDRRNDELFAWCAAHNVPIFSHTTPGGFEAGTGYGRKSCDPDLWRPVLDRHPIRLCLGHSGGGEGWFQPNTSEGDAAFEQSFSGKAYRLACDYENVYCDFGMLDEVFDPGQIEHLRCRLVARLRSTPQFGDRICYGSDWHMLYRDLRSDEYLHAFETLFAGAPLDQYRDRFFFANAARYLGITP